jgi:hypothetical protein
MRTHALTVLDCYRTLCIITCTTVARVRFLRNFGCSTPSEHEWGSPMWGGAPIPKYGAVYWWCMVLPPTLASGDVTR